MSGMGAARGTRPLLARTAVVGAVLMTVIVASSAYLRLSSIGVGCEPWPSCYGRVDAAMTTAIDLSSATGIARLLHRVSAMAVAFVVAFALLLALSRPLRRRGNVAAAVGLCLLTAVLAMVGRQSAGSLVPMVGLVNLCGGFGMLVLFGWLWACNRGGDPLGLPPASRSLALVLIVAVTVQIALGALVSVTYAAPACRGYIDCALPVDGVASALAAFQPAAPLSVDAAGRVTAPLGAASMQWLHRLLGWTLGAALVVYGAFVASRGRRAGAALALLALCVAGVGTLMVANGYPLSAVMAHNLGAAALLLALVVLSVHARRRARSTPAAPD